ncbi:MAG: glycosyltransferase [Steroidobacteraceae bacterium]
MSAAQAQRNESEAHIARRHGGMKARRCLWISRDIPFPQDAGDRIYSANLAASLARAGVDVRFLGYLQGDARQVPDDWVTEWLPVSDAKRNAHLALFSRYPRIAAMHATPSYRKLLQQQLSESWDAIVLDGYGSGWALSQCLAARRHTAGKPALIYVSHNHEATVWRAMLDATGPALNRSLNRSLKRLGIWQNYRKTCVLERELAESADLVTTITEEDARAYAAQHSSPAELQRLVLTPGYSGRSRIQRRITEATPRHVLMMGSFRWLIKQENLRQLLTVADSIFALHGITLDVIGDMPQALLSELQSQSKSARFHGFVDDPSSLLDQARIALVPEAVGGGFKLKLLDYVFNRIPVATLTAAAAGLPAGLQHYTISCPDLESLTRAVVHDIDSIDKLNHLQDQAYNHALPLFRWDARGERLAGVIEQLRTFP